MSALSAILPITRSWTVSRPVLANLAVAFLLQWMVLSVAYALLMSPSLTRYQISPRTVIISPDVTPREFRPGWIVDWDGLFTIPMYVAGFLSIAWILVALITRAFPTFRRLLWPSQAPENGNASRSVEEFISHRGKVDTKDIPVLDRAIVMQEIDQRIGRLTNRTSGILVAIAFALVAAAFVVLFAGRLTSLDAEAVSNVDRAKSELAEATRALSRLYRYHTLFQQMDTLGKRLDENPSLSARDDLQKQISDRRREIEFLSRESVSMPSDALSASSMIAAQQKDVDSIRSLLDEVWKKELLQDRGYGDWRYIVATAITRVGVVLIIVFLVQILMGLYRYNTRLVAYYSSRRDLLTLWDGNQKTLKPLDQVLAPPRVDFGKEPKHPLEDIIRAMGSKLRPTKTPPVPGT
jgi:hypothetical protein